MVRRKTFSSSLRKRGDTIWQQNEECGSISSLYFLPHSSPKLPEVMTDLERKY